MAEGSTARVQPPIPDRIKWNRNAIERVFKELKRRTKQFANHFKHAEAETAENWLQTFAFTWNQLI